MLLPLVDVMPFRRVPIVTLALIGLHAIAFVVQPAAERLTIAAGSPAAAATDLSVMLRAGLVSFAAHLDWIHLGANMAALWLFGSTLEDRMGRARFLLFYAGTAAAAMAAFQAAFPGELVPLGAGPVIAGVLATYVIRFPTSRMLALFVPVFWIDVIEIPAIVWMAVWMMAHITSAATALSSGFAPSLPWQAYVAGGLCGAAGALTRFRISAETSASSPTRRSNSLS